MDVCFVTTAKTDEEGKELLKALGKGSCQNLKSSPENHYEL